ncbi:MAG: metalloregulator ArsR/SmtB family transcription factor [Firmicutes bacterium]|nr:metalloregulator ArsR/SmtB family transcription factor [Bacillota bacterium]
MDPDRRFKDEAYAQVARLAKAVSHPRRLELLDLLCQGAMTVEELAQKSAMSVANCSQHLQQLKAAGLVRAEVRRQTRRYQLVDDGVCDLLRLLHGLAERYYAELRVLYHDFMGGSPALEALDPAGLLDRLADQSVVLLDVRPRSEYEAGHLPGALSVPFEALATELAKLPRERPVAAYCRGPFCVLSLHAVELLREAGFDAFRIPGGVSEWRGRVALVRES